MPLKQLTDGIAGKRPGNQAKMLRIRIQNLFKSMVVHVTSCQGMGKGVAIPFEPLRKFGLVALAQFYGETRELL